MVVRRENYIAIQGWMIADLELKGNELLIYAIIYGFSQNENQRYTGSLQYLAEWTNTTRRSVINSLKALVDKGLILKYEKLEKGVKFCEYVAAPFSPDVKSFHQGGEKISQGVGNNFTGDGENFSPNNLLNNPIDTKEDKIDSPTRHKYGFYKNVLLTDEDMEKLKAEFPADWEKRIERLSEYIASKGAKYKNHLATIRAWARKEAPQKSDKPRYENVGKFV